MRLILFFWFNTHLLIVVKNEMVTMLLSMMEGNDKESRIARQMVRTLVESRPHVEVLLNQFHSVAKLCDRGLQESFRLYDTNNDGFVSARYPDSIFHLI